jgi:AraC family transcriptional regulator of adaptative response/methylated-DNA-[protein]-cysteine methyltransferase
MTDEPQDYHYGVIRRALGIIDAAGPGLTLGALAHALGMSEAHFQRVFSAWVGVSPKRYQQYLALGAARAMLEARAGVQEAAAAAGLSGAGRLHDLTLRWEAMRPGEIARRGEGVTLRAGTFPSPFGSMVAVATGHGIAGLAFASETGAEAALADLAARWPAARIVPDAPAVAPFVTGIFAPRPRVALHLIGAPFQIKVWEALLAIPSGEVTTYGAIAARIGAPRAVRAVGTAVGRNPVSFLIPCHRALRGTGALGGYHWGLPVKRAMLAWEAARADALAEG